MRKFLLIFFLVFLTLAFLHNVAEAQTYNMNSTKDSTCTGTFYDGGGSGGNYPNSSSVTKTFVSKLGKRLVFKFFQFSLYGDGYDYLKIYDGPTNAYPVIGTYYGGNSPDSIISSGVALTFEFYSSFSNNSSGWGANISCYGTPLPTYNMKNGNKDSVCDAVFYDTGGPDVNYGNGENNIHTFASKSGSRLKIRFNPNFLGLSGSDSLFVYDGPNVSARPLAVYVGGTYPELLRTSGSTVTFKFKSDASGTAQGWQAFLVCDTTSPQATKFVMSSGVRYVCNGSFQDPGGTGYYNNSGNNNQTFKSYSGNRLQVSFNTFSMYPDGYDYLKIYDGPNSSYPVIGTYYGSNSPGNITSSSDALTFEFYSSYSNNYPGWDASFSCAGPVLPVYKMKNGSKDSVCAAVFYDSGGPNADYQNGETLVHTFYSKSKTHLKLNINQNGSYINSNDSLFVYDGSSTSSPLLAVYVPGSTFEPLISSGIGLTFKFKSDGSNTYWGWQALLDCDTSSQQATKYIMSSGIRNICNGTFQDPGGSGYYNNSGSNTQTFKSYSGNRLQVSFSAFNMYPDGYDYLKVYDGPNSSYPVIGTYYGSNSPGTITSSGDALTFEFYSSYANNYPGWDASFSCAGPVLPVYKMKNGAKDSVCAVVFYDSGGPNSDYQNGENLVHTFYSKSKTHLRLNINQNGSYLNVGDSLFVYDGNSTSSPLLAVYVQNSTFEPLISSGSALTFRHKSDGSYTSWGWQAFLDCDTSSSKAQNYVMSSGVRYICNGAFQDPGGSGYYNNSSNYNQTFKSYTGNRLQVSFSTFNMYPDGYDYLKIYDGPNSSYPVIGTYYGSNSPGTITSSKDALTFEFYSSYANNYPGWDAFFSCAGPVLPIYKMKNGAKDSVCAAVFYDSGGPNSDYQNGETLVHTFYSKSKTHLSLNINQNGSYINSNDSLFVYDGASTSSPLLAVYVPGSTFEPLISTGSAMTFKFKSDGSNTSIGWQAYLDCDTGIQQATKYIMSAGVRYICNGTFQDPGGSGYYNNSGSNNQTFKSYSGNRLQVSFNTFNMYPDGYDYLKIYDGPNSSYPVIGTYYGSSSPGVITSSKDALTFEFYSSYANNYPGWDATFSCAGPVLPIYKMKNGAKDSVCAAVFYDSGGPNSDYQNGENLVHTFYSKSKTHLRLNINQNGSYINVGDSLFVYDGNSTSAPLLAVYVQNSTFEPLISSGSALTFRLKSDGSYTSWGWQAYLDCDTSSPKAQNYVMSSGVRYICNGTFQDPGGSGYYPNSANYNQTFKSYSGNRLQVNFNSFNLYGDGYDYLKIYDGPNSSYPVIGTYYGSNSPGLITSSGEALTFEFYSSYANNYPGWDATFYCAGPVLPVYKIKNGAKDSVCDAVFYDSGGPNADYQNGENLVHTFYSKSKNHLKVSFNPNYYINTYDTLIVFDGPNSSSPKLAQFVSGSLLEPLVSSGSALTFQFKSDGSNVSNGWQAFLECDTVGPVTQNYMMSPGVRYVCNGTFTDQGGSSGNYSNSSNLATTFKSYSGGRLSLNFTSFSLYPDGYDYMQVFDGPGTNYPLLGTFYGSASPGMFTSSGDALTVFFYSSYANNAAGWTANISCGGPTLPIYKIKSGSKDSICDAVFYDSGGPTTDYQNGENITHTFCGKSGNRLLFLFNPNVINIASGDSLYVYDGASTSSTPIGIYSQNSVIEPISGSGNCVTFRFKSDGSGTWAGWQAIASCMTNIPATPVYKMSSGVRFTCTGSFTDDGGTTANYSNNMSRVESFRSDNGKSITLDFSQFALSSDNLDYIKIYDGPNTSATLKGTYKYATSPGTVTSTGSALTIEFYSSNSNNNAGWEAAISCSGKPGQPILASNGPVCTGDTIKLYTAAVNGVTYNWTGPNGFTSTLQSPIILNAKAANAGTYKAVITRSSLTSDTSYINLVVNAIPSAPTASGNSPVCAGDSIKLNAKNVSGGTWYWSGPNSFYSYSQNTYVKFANTAKAGNYYVYVTVNGCKSPQTTVPISVTTVTTPTIASNSPVCPGDSIKLKSGGVSGATYSWSGPSGFSSASQNPNIAFATTKRTGYYYVNAKVGSCTSSSNNIYVKVDSVSRPVASGSASLCTGDTLKLSASSISGATYSWTGPNSFTSTLQYPKINNITSANTGKYYVQALIGGCKSLKDSITINVNFVTRPTATSNSPVCENAALNLSGSGPSGAGYLWTGPNAFSSSLKNPSINPVALTNAGKYYLRASQGSCLSAPDSVIVTVNKVPATPTAGSNITVCAGDTIKLTSSTISGATYSWTGPNSFTSTLQNPQITNVSSVNGGTYYVRSLQTGCYSIAASASVTVNTVSAPSASNNGPVCEGDSLKLKAGTVSGATYNWTGPNSFTSTLQNPGLANVSTVAGGLYSVKALMSGCTSTASTTNAKVNAKPIAGISGNNSVCTGSTQTYSAGSTLNTYKWTVTGGTIVSGGTSSSVSISWGATGSGNLKLVETNSSSCKDSQSLAIIINAHGTPGISGSTLICAGNAANYKATKHTGSSYFWKITSGSIISGGSSDSVIVAWSGSGAGTIKVLETNAGGCTDSATLPVSISPQPAAVVASSQSICPGKSVNLGSTSVSGNTYTWISKPAGFTSTNSNPSASPSVKTTYYLTEKNTTYGCTKTDSVTISIVPVPRPAISGISGTCINSTSWLKTKKTTGNSYSWSLTGGSIISGINTDSINIKWSNAGIQSAKVVETNAGGCKDSATYGVTVYALPKPSPIGATLICSGASANYKTTKNAGSNYMWTVNRGTITSGASSDSVIILWGSSGTGTAYISETNANGCTDSAKISVSILALPTANAGSSKTICPGQTASIGTSAVSGHTYSWSSKPVGFSSTLSNPSVSPSTSTTYYLTEKNTTTGCQKSDSVVISIAPKPTPIIKGSNSVCPSSVAGYKVAKITGSSYTWSVSGGAVISGNLTDTLTVKWGSAGSGSLKIVETNAGGCKDSATYSVTINSLPKPSPTGATILCAGSSAYYKTTKNTGSSYSWIAIGGSINSGTFTDSITVAWGSAGTGTIKVTETNANGCTDSAKISISLLPLPLANAGSSQTICTGKSVSLGAASVSGHTYSWSSKPAGYSSTLANPSVSPTLSTTYYMTERITSSGCSRSDSVTITVSPLPAPVIAGSKSVCPSMITGYKTAKNSGSTYAWTISGGTILSGSTTDTLTVKWGSAGTGSLKIIETNAGGCKDSNTISVIINSLPKPAIVGTNLICAGNTGWYKTKKNIGSVYSWTINGGSISSGSGTDSINISWTSSGSGLVKVIETNASGCMDSTTYNVTVNPVPSAKVAANQSICTGVSLNIGSAAVSGNTYSWSSKPTGFTSTLSNPSVSPTTSTVYYLKETISSTGCSKMDSVTITVSAKPTPGIKGLTAVCNGTITSYSTPLHTGATYKWTITLGTISSGQGTDSIVVNWNTTGSGSLKVVETASGGCKDSASQSITINALPKPAVTGTASICAGNNGWYKTKKNTGSSYNWKVAGGSILSGQGTDSITVNWPNSGAVAVKVVETNSAGCADSNTVILNINALPTASTGSSRTICLGQTTSIGATSTSGHSYIWTSKPSGFSSTLANPNVSPTVNTTYYLTESINSTGCSKGDSVVITVSPKPGTSFTGGTSFCTGASRVYLAKKHTGSTYNWFVSGGSISSGAGTDSVTISWTNAGSGSIKLVETGAGGCKDSQTLGVTVSSAPKVSFTSNKVCAGAKTTFTNKTTGATKYFWKFGDGDTANVSNPTHTYKKGGTYIATLIARNSGGCIDSTSASVSVDTMPKAAFSFANTCIFDTTSFTDSSKNAVSWAWKFGDGNTSTLQNPINTYYFSGKYKVSLTIKSSGGCQDTISHRITVSTPPNPVFSAKGSGNKFNFTADDTLQTGYVWDFGDGNGGTGYKTAHTYSKTGLYHVYLTVTNSTGCSDIYDSFLVIFTGIQTKTPEFSLNVFPNPFKDQTSLEYNLPNDGHVQIIVYDLNGRELLSIANERQIAGKHSYLIDGNEQLPVQSLYLMKMIVDDKVYIKQIIRVK